MNAWLMIRNARKAGRKITYNGNRVYIDGVIAFDPDKRPEQAPTDDENRMKLWMYGEALHELARENPCYVSNVNMWRKWDDDQRLWWIRAAERQAERCDNTVGVQVLTRAVQIRLLRTPP